MGVLQKNGRSKRLCWGALFIATVLLADVIVGVYVILNGTVSRRWCKKCHGQNTVGELRHGEMCCTENSTANADMLTKIYLEARNRVQSTLSPAGYSRPDRNLRPHAHLQGIKISQNNIGGDHLRTIETWYDEKEGSSDVDNGVILRHGRLVAPISGLYLIYTHMDFTEQYRSESERTNRNTSRPEIQHNIFRFNILREEQGEELLFGRTLSRCRHQTKATGNDEYGSYVAAMAQLQAGDEISVGVTNIDFLSNNPSSHYFGMHML